MNMKEWEKEYKELPAEQQEEIRNALESLRTWKTFNKEFEWTGIFSLATIFKYAKEDAQ